MADKFVSAAKASQFHAARSAMLVKVSTWAWATLATNAEMRPAVNHVLMAGFCLRADRLGRKYHDGLIIKLLIDRLRKVLQ